MIQHLVLLKIRRDVPKKQVDALFELLAGMKKVMPGLASFAGGPYSSPEGLHKGFTHGFAMTFENAQARDGYLTHPEHVKIKERVLAVLDGGLDGVVAFDFESE